MSTPTSKYASLMNLAKEPCSTKRRELLREVTNLFFDSEQKHTDIETGLYDEILGIVSQNMETEVRLELSRKVADIDTAPRRIVKRLAKDEILVAAPILERSKALNDDDLIEVIQSKGQAHMMAVTKRKTVSESVSDALVDHGEDEVIVSLLHNENASLYQQTYEKVTDRALNSKTLHSPLIERKSVPLHLINELYMTVEQSLRDKIIERNNSVSLEELDAALNKSRIRVSQSLGALPKDYEESAEWLKAQKAKGWFEGPTLVSLLRNAETTKFLLGLADLTGVDYETTHWVYKKADIDALAMLCRAAKFERALFITLASLVGDSDQPILRHASSIGEMYSELPVETAQRAIRFWQVRKKTQPTQSAA